MLAVQRLTKHCGALTAIGDIWGVDMKRALLALSIALAAACGPAVDVAKSVQIEAVSTGWLDAGVVEGKNKVVPSVAFKLKNISGQPLTALQVNAVFRRATTDEEIGNEFRPVAGSGGLAPGTTTDTISLKAQLGYTGTDPHDALLRNSQFADAKVDLFVKAGSAQWVRVGEYPIARQLNGN
jgi:hypothetical protein